jgi:hypothetical protein
MSRRCVLTGIAASGDSYSARVPARALAHRLEDRALLTRRKIVLFSG